MTDYTSILPATDLDLQRILCVDMGPSGTPYDRVHLDIDEDGAVSLTTRTYYGGDSTPMEIWHGRTLRYTVNPGADAEWLREHLAEGGELATLIDRIVAGHSVHWDGSNHVGRLTDEAQDASERLDALLSDAPLYSGSWSDAETWLIGDRRLADIAREIDADTTAQDLVSQAEGDGWIITDGIGGMESALQQVREAARGAAEE